MEGPRELHHAMLECEMLRESCIKVLEEVAKYLKTDNSATGGGEVWQGGRGRLQGEGAGKREQLQGEDHCQGQFGFFL